MLNLRRSFGLILAMGAGFLVTGARPAMAQVPYSVTFNDGNEGSWNNIYAQGFNTSLGAAPTPGASAGDTVDLSQFQFFKSGNTDSAANIQLVILNNFFTNMTGLTLSSPNVVGISTNTLASTAALTLGQPETFTFNNLPLTYGNDYGAVFVNVGAGGALTPVLVSALTVNYAEQSDSMFHPVTNYGTESQFQYATSNFINSGFFSDFSFAGDAAFSASLNTVPEPASLAICSLTVLGLLRRRSR
jgi:hypothetical protein